MPIANPLFNTLVMKGFVIRRLNCILMGTGELYYMQILLAIQKNCAHFNNIKIVNEIIYRTFKEACYILSLLKDNREFVNGIKETSDLGSGH